MHHTGTVIRAARKAQKLTLRDLARLADIDHSTISRIERGEYDPPARTIKALTDALGRNMGGAA